MSEYRSDWERASDAAKVAKAAEDAHEARLARANRGEPMTAEDIAAVALEIRRGY